MKQLLYWYVKALNLVYCTCVMGGLAILSMVYTVWLFTEKNITYYPLLPLQPIWYFVYCFTENNGAGGRWNPSSPCVCGWSWFQSGHRQETWSKYYRPLSQYHHRAMSLCLLQYLRMVSVHIFTKLAHTTPKAPDVLAQPPQRAHPWKLFGNVIRGMVCWWFSFYHILRCWIQMRKSLPSRRWKVYDHPSQGQMSLRWLQFSMTSQQNVAGDGCGMWDDSPCQLHCKGE